MKTYLDIYDVKNSQKQDEHGENCEKYVYHPHFQLFLLDMSRFDYKLQDLHSKPRKLKINSFMQWIKVGLKL